MTPVLNLLGAPSHPDPYPFYASLRARNSCGLHFDEPTRLWVASTRDAVQEVLRHPSLRVRPTAEPVPKAIQGTPAGQLFGALMRQNDGPVHRQGKDWAVPFLAKPWPVASVVDELVAANSSPRHRPLNDLMFEAPVRVLQVLLGAGDGRDDLASQVRRVVTGWSPSANDDARHAASLAAEALLQRFNGDANRIGLFTQTCEATAGLIGNTLVALQREQGLRERWLPDPSLDDALAQEVARHDAPVQNTRRFVAEDTELRGIRLKAGDTILVLLASANRDTSVSPDADHFRLGRSAPSILTWGTGAHECPGAALSRQIAMALVRAWHEGNPMIETLTTRWTYRPSPNGRLPLFA